MVTRGQTVLLFEEGECSRLTNWQPITLLHTIHKIFAKALQRRLQPLLIEVTDSDQTVFLPLKFVLDYILLLHESIQWAKVSRQDTIFFKLDFSKTYDSVDWALMFQVMGKLRMPNTFIQMIRMIFHDAMVCQYQQLSNKAFRTA